MMLPEWALQVLACPQTREPLVFDNNHLVSPGVGVVAEWKDGIVHFSLPEKHPSIEWYERLGGTHALERSQIPFTMSSLDTPVYRRYLESIRPRGLDGFIVDIGGGDGRNSLPWLEWGYRHVICLDPIPAALERLRDLVSREHPDWLDHLLLVVGDVRRLPIATGSAHLALAVEVLYYLNEDYEQGLSECARIARPGGSLLVCERTWEGALVTRLLYEGVPGMLAMVNDRYMYDGYGDNLVRSRTFTGDELAGLVERLGLEVVDRGGTSILPLLLGYFRGRDELGDSVGLFEATQELMQILWERGVAKRTVALLCRKP